MAITRGQIMRLALHNQVDYTTNFFTAEIREAKFQDVIDDITQEIDFPELYSNSAGDLSKSSTIFDITNPAASTYRYTFNGGFKPSDFSSLISIGDTIELDIKDADSDNNGTFTLTGVDDDYFEVTNADGVVESGVQVKKGYVFHGDYVTVSGQCDYALPSNFQKTAGGLKIGTGHYLPIDEDIYLLEANHVRNSFWLEGTRFVLSSNPGANQRIILPYYKDHPSVNDTTSLTLPDEARNALRAGTEWKFTEIDEGNTVSEAQAKLGEYEREKGLLRTFINSRRLKGKRHVFNDVPEDTFDV